MAAAARKSIGRGIWTGLVIGLAIPLARRFGFDDPMPLVSVGFVVLLFWFSIDAFNNAPVRTVSRSASSTDKMGAWLIGLGGHAIVALILAALAGGGYNVARGVWHNIKQEAEERERLRFVVEPYAGPLLEAKESGSNLRDRPLRDDELAPVVRETVAGEHLTVTGQVNQEDGVWYQLELSDGRTAYIKASLTVERPRPRTLPPVEEGPMEFETLPPSRPPPPPRVLYPPPPPPPPVIYEPVRIAPPVYPEYPARAEQRQIEGSVAIGFTIFEDGSTGNFYVVDETPRGYGFADSAIAAIRQWRYRPRMVDGRPVRHRVVEEIPFVLIEQRR